jgi:hypothetical protein
MLSPGYYRARAVEYALGKTQNGTRQVAVRFEVLDEQGAPGGERVTWYGYFTEKTAERTLESLQYCGWEGDDVTDLTGIERNEVQIVVEHEEYEGENQRARRLGEQSRRREHRHQGASRRSREGSFCARDEGEGPGHAPGTAPRPRKPERSRSSSGAAAHRRGSPVLRRETRRRHPVLRQRASREVTSLFSRLPANPRRIHS